MVAGGTIRSMARRNANTAGWLDRAGFDRLVGEALDSLPPGVRRWLENVEVLVAERPTRAQLAGVDLDDMYDLLGLYEGTPLTERGVAHGMVEPDRVTLFRLPILAVCQTAAEVRDEVRQTVLHELAHHFGIDDDRLEALGAY